MIYFFSEYLVLPLQEANIHGRHGSTYLYDEKESRKSSRSSQDFSMADIVRISKNINLRKWLLFSFKGWLITSKSSVGVRRKGFKTAKHIINDENSPRGNLKASLWWHFSRWNAQKSSQKGKKNTLFFQSIV